MGGFYSRPHVPASEDEIAEDVAPLQQQFDELDDPEPEAPDSDIAMAGEIAEGEEAALDEWINGELAGDHRSEPEYGIYAGRNDNNFLTGGDYADFDLDHYEGESNLPFGEEEYGEPDFALQDGELDEYWYDDEDLGGQHAQGSNIYPGDDEFGEPVYEQQQDDEFDEPLYDDEEEGENELPSSPPPASYPSELSDEVQLPPRPQKKQKFGTRRDLSESPLRYFGGPPSPILPDRSDDVSSPKFPNVARRLRFSTTPSPRRSTTASSPRRSTSDAIMPYEAPSTPRSAAPPARQPRQPRGRDITPDYTIRSPISPNSGRRLPYNFRRTTRPSQIPSSSPRTPTRPPPPPTLRSTKRRSGRRPSGVQKRGRKPGRKGKKKQFRCPNCNVEITLTPNGHPSAKLKTPEGTIGRRVAPVLPVTQVSPLGFKTFRGKDGRLYLRKKNRY